MGSSHILQLCGSFDSLQADFCRGSLLSHGGGEADRVRIPDILQVPAGNVFLTRAHARGVQKYTCPVNATSPAVPHAILLHRGERLVATRTRQGARDEDGKEAETHPAPDARGDQTPRRQGGASARDCPHPSMFLTARFHGFTPKACLLSLMFPPSSR